MDRWYNSFSGEELFIIGKSLRDFSGDENAPERELREKLLDEIKVEVNKRFGFEL